MKKLFVLMLLSVLCLQQIYAQKDIEIAFENGEKKMFRFDYDDPGILPRLSIDLRFFGTMVFHEPDLSFRISPLYRVNKKLTVQGIFTRSYGVTEDERWVEYGAKVGQDWSLMAHYNLLSGNRTEQRKHAVDFDHGATETVYTAKLPRVIGHNLSVDGGVADYRYYDGRDLVNLEYRGTGSSDTSYEMVNVSGTGLNLGLSYFTSQSYKMTTDKISRSYWRTFRAYGYLSIGLINNYEVNRFIYHSGEATRSFEKAESGFEEPGIAAFGYRFGLERAAGFKNSPFSLVFGLETGKLPGVKKNDSPKSIFLFHIGAGLNSKPVKL